MRRVFLTTVTILVAMLVMLGALGYYAYANYAREQALIRGSLGREGHAWLQALEAGMRTSVARSARHESELDHLIDEMSEAPGIEFIIIEDAHGHRLAAAGDAPLPQALNSFDGTTVPEDGREWLSADRQWFAVARRFDPLAQAGRIDGESAIHRWHRWCSMRGTDPGEGGLVAIIGLATEEYLSAQAEDTRRLVGTSALLVLLGLSAVYAVFLGHRSSTMRQALEQARTYADSVVDSISNGVLSVDRGGLVVAINRIGCQLLGTSPDQAVGRHYSYLIQSGDCRLEPTILEGARVFEKETRCTTLSGDDIHVAVSASQLVSAQGDVLGAVAVLRDLQPLRALEEQLRRSDRLASMGRMVAGVAHELRNPLSSLRGFAGYFARKYEDVPEDREYAELMEQEVDRLNRVISELLSFSQPVIPRREDVILRATIAYALRLTSAELDTRGVEVDHTYAEDLPALQADGDLLVQVFVNLFLNAAEAMQQGGRLRICADGVTEGVQITVSDTGAGIAPAQRERVFDPFFTTKPDGTGLGLAIVHAIIQSHEGRIDVSSDVDVGTSFRIVLPTECGHA